MQVESEIGAPNRRDFLKLVGFSLAGAGLAGCAREPIEKAIPYLVQPEEIVPGQSVWYASTCSGCAAGCGVLVKCRDGRPIKLEGNPAHPVSRGGLCAAGQASVLELYDSHCLPGPTIAGRAATWPEVDAAIGTEFDRIARQGGAVRLLSGSAVGPTARRAIERFLARFADARHVIYDALSASAILDAHQRTHGRRVLPRYRFDRAAVIAGVDADFLGTWISPVEYTAGWAAGRRLGGASGGFSHHTQFESILTVTGSKADERFVIGPRDTHAVLAHLLAAVGELAGRRSFPAPSAPCRVDAAALRRLASRLWESPGRSLVVCGTNDVDLQVLVNALNELLGGYGQTLDIDAPSGQRRGDDAALYSLLEEIRSGHVTALLVWGADPVYELPGGEALAAALAKVPLVVDFARRRTATAAHARYACPDLHALESWTDAEPVAGVAAVGQPAVRPLRDGRSVLESLAAWSGEPAAALDLVRRTWEEEIYPRRAASDAMFESFWQQALQDGFAAAPVPAQRPAVFDASAVRAPAAAAGATGLALVLYPTVAMHDGRHGHNPWLHEMPDPISKLTWGNTAALSPATAARLGVRDGDVVRVAVQGGAAIELPAHVQPGQDDGVVAVPLGYGVRGTDRFTNLGRWWWRGRPVVAPGELVGRNAAPLLRFDASGITYAGAVADVVPTGGRAEIACTQEHHEITVPEHLAPRGMARRPAVLETTLDEARAAHAAAPAGHAVLEEPSMWTQDHSYPGKRWGMVIDLAACTGCSACVVACQIENNVPVVGRDEVRRSREMHWMRIDRYYADDGAGGVDVLHQPMLCHHCGNAPCETVCPVLATAHSSEGLNQQVYNRCVGTRYCANNCPFKVRRFNWFEYRRGDAAGMEDLVLNPDVTTRSRGVMEKCSFCVQRLQEAKQEARRQGREAGDGDVQTACQQSCPAQAIVFGDTNDASSAVSRARRDPRHYRILAELNIRPQVGYLKLVRHRTGMGHRPQDGRSPGTDGGEHHG